MTKKIGLAETLDHANQLLSGTLRGRTVLTVSTASVHRAALMKLILVFFFLVPALALHWMARKPSSLEENP
jgi:hypothetical protein